MRPAYGALRLRATVVAIVMFVVMRSIFAAMQAVTLSQGLAVLLIGGPLAALFAGWPIALKQGLKAMANAAEYAQEHQSRVR